MPVFNEAEHIDAVLGAVWKYATDILVVDDGSTDPTSRILEKHCRVTVITHRQNLGYGQSLIDAIEYSRRHYFDWLVTIDCDGQHQPSYIPRFLEQIEKDNADIVSGSRYLNRLETGHAPPERVTINKEITAILNRRLGIALTDAFCGFKAYRVKAVSELRLDETGYGFPLQLWVRAARAGLRIREVPVPLIYHDPNRKFGGLLENPRYRRNYYVSVIRKELDACKNLKRSERS